MITRNHRQESLSRAYVQAVAARAGAVCSVPDLAYGIDLTLRAVDETDGFVDAGVLLDLQLKATTNADVRDPATIGFDLRVADYDKLRRPDVPIPRVLVVLELPPDEAEWAAQTVGELILRRTAFWISLRGRPAVDVTTTTRARLPRTNLFTPATVTDLLARVRAGGVP
ncbi:MAG: DUF4365 domain-containing protein [Planctomycetes bacterium]|nr:DUF4365 domain-containing protein [Planctomycetota bacterium]